MTPRRKSDRIEKNKQAKLTSSFKTTKRGSAQSAIKKPQQHDKPEQNQVKQSKPTSELTLVEAETAIEIADETVGKRLNFADSKFEAYLATHQAVNHVAPIHQEGVTVVERILKHFDLTEQYGPTVGMTRLQRWQRASKLGLSPPEIVHEILISRDGRENDNLKQGYLFGQI
ncbi:DNA polymerase delta, subunit 4-domain-containing protein [Lipomyces japonicus]|uniref:DNA polymerase delta, subunit 4-domain-containing protein n=1 Tax=Lipomyces japonicus TaxID=56871 RepID=UPI0034CD75DE